jgi:hypothetical protein
MQLRAAGDGICGGLNSALAAAADARGESMPFALIKQPLGLVGATAWEAHYNGTLVLRVPLP